MLGEEEKRPLVGVGVFLYNSEGKILLGKRKGAHGAGQWSLPGGHLEFKESFGQCCEREVKEETDIEIGAYDIKKLGFTNDIFEKEDLHYVTLFFRTEVYTAGRKNIPKLMEPDKCEGWEWFGLDELPSPLFPALKQIVKLKPIIEF
jgi:8-oxo-dGTP diphosphatase